MGKFNCILLLCRVNIKREIKMAIKIKKTQAINILYAILLISILSVISLVGVTITTNSVIGVNVTNATVITRVYVWNTEPDLYNVVISPNPVELTSAGTTVVNCTGYFFDYNGWRDANLTVNATFYDSSMSSAGNANDNNYHYTNSSCVSSCKEISATNGTCACLFTVQYYANSSNWVCNYTIIGSGGNASERLHLNFTDSMNTSTQINNLLSLSVPATNLDYGNLSVTEISRSIEQNITNTGNIPFNVTVSGYGGTDPTVPGIGNWSMRCDLGNISIGNEKFSIFNDTAYASMTNLTGNDTQIANITFFQRTNDNNEELGRDRNQTFWRLQIPLSVGGYCNGTIIFKAVAAN